MASEPLPLLKEIEYRIQRIDLELENTEKIIKRLRSIPGGGDELLEHILAARNHLLQVRKILTDYDVKTEESFLEYMKKKRGAEF